MSKSYYKVEHSETENTWCGCSQNPNGVSGKKGHPSKDHSRPIIMYISTNILGKSEM